MEAVGVSLAVVDAGPPIMKTIRGGRLLWLYRRRGTPKQWCNLGRPLREMMIMATPVAQKVAEDSLTAVDAGLPIMKISRRETPAAAQKSVERPVGGNWGICWMRW